LKEKNKLLLFFSFRTYLKNFIAPFNLSLDDKINL